MAAVEDEGVAANPIQRDRVGRVTVLEAVKPRVDVASGVKALAYGCDLPEAGATTVALELDHHVRRGRAACLRPHRDGQIHDPARAHRAHGSHSASTRTGEPEQPIRRSEITITANPWWRGMRSMLLTTSV